jgi:NADH-quinone oxidoreductase subunit K
MAIPQSHLMILSLALVAIGILGVLIRRNVVIILMSIELILNAANINFVAFSAKWHHLTGQIWGVFNITIAAAEVAVGLAIVIALFRNRETVNVDEMNLMKW